MMKIIASVVIAWMYLYSIIKNFNLTEPENFSQQVAIGIVSLVSRTVPFAVIYWALGVILNGY